MVDIGRQEQQAVRASRLHQAAWPLLIAAVTGSVYWWTLMPGPGGSGDTLKFQFIGKLLGVPHAPGYPTYVALDWLFAHLPFGSLAYRINLMSAVFAVVAVVLVYGVIARATRHQLAAFLGALVFAFSPVFWSRAVMAEVYSLNAAFFAATLFLLVLWLDTSRLGYLQLAFFVYAFSFGNHVTMITLLPAFVWAMLAGDRGAAFRPRTLLLAGVAVILGASQYAFTALRAWQTPVAYSELTGGFSLGSFLRFVAGGEFQSRLFAFSASQLLLDRLPMYAHLLMRQISAIGVLGGLAGIVLCLRRRRLGILFVLAFLGNCVFVLNYDMPAVEDLFIPSFLVMSIFLGYTLAWLFSWVGLAGRNRRSLVLRAALPVVLFLVASPTVVSAYGYANQRNNVDDAWLVASFIQRLPKGTILLNDDYRTHVFQLYYLLGEGRRAGDDIYAIQTYSPGQTVEDYRAGKTTTSFDGRSYQLPAGLHMIYTGTDTGMLSSHGLNVSEVRYNDGTLLSFLAAVPPSSLVLLSAQGNVVGALDGAQQAFADLGITRLPANKATSYIAIGGHGVEGLAATVMTGSSRLILILPRDAALGPGYQAPLPITITSAGSTTSRLQAVVSDLRRMDLRQLRIDLRVPSNSMIVVDGKDRSPGKRGLNVVVLDAATGAFRSATNVDSARTLGIDETVVYDVAP